MNGELGKYQGFRFIGFDLAKGPDLTGWSLYQQNQVRLMGKTPGRGWFKDLYMQEWPCEGDPSLTTDFIAQAQKATSFGARVIQYRGKPLTYAQEDYVARRLAARNQSIKQFNQALHDSVAHTTVNTKPESTVMDRDDLMAAMSRELRKHAQVEKELEDARRTNERQKRSLECQGNRIVNLDAQLAQQMGDNERQRRTIYDLEAQLRNSQPDLRERCNAQLISLSQLESQLTNQARTIEAQRQEIGKLHSMVSRREFERDEANARNLRQKATIDALETQLKSYQVDSPYLGDVRFGSGQSAAVVKPQQATNEHRPKPVMQRFGVAIGGGSAYAVQITDEEHRNFLAGAQAAGKRIQVWHLKPFATNSGAGQWDDIRGKSDFQCPAHLYRVHPEDL